MVLRTALADLESQLRREKDEAREARRIAAEVKAELKEKDSQLTMMWKALEDQDARLNDTEEREDDRRTHRRALARAEKELEDKDSLLRDLKTRARREEEKLKREIDRLVRGNW